MRPGAAATIEKSQPDLPALTGLRFFAAFFILFAHAVDWLAQFQDSEIRAQFRFVSIYGMPLFFVLSGFVIHYNYNRLFSLMPVGRAVSEFAAARFARLFPLYFFMLIVSILADNFLTAMAHRPDEIKVILLSYLSCTQSWFYLVFDGRLIINLLFPLSWSISTEIFFYVAYVPLTFVFLRMVTVRTALTASIVYAIVVVLIFISSRYELNAILAFARNSIEGFVRHDVAFQHSFYRWLFYFSPYARIFEFVMGCLAAHVFLLTRGRPISTAEHRLGTVVLLVALALLVVAGLLYTDTVVIGSANLYVRHLALNFLCAPAIAAILFCVSRYETRFAAFMSSSLLVGLGETSYSIYMVHTWTLRIFNHPAPPLNLVSGTETVFRVVIAMIFTILVAYATYRLIEVPARAWLRSVFAKWIGARSSDRKVHDPLPGIQQAAASTPEIPRATISKPWSLS